MNWFKSFSRTVILTVVCIATVTGFSNGSSKEDDAKILAAELRAIRTVCVVPTENDDGSLAYSDAGTLAKVLRDQLTWEASVCDVVYHAGHKFSLRDSARYDAYLELSRYENSWGSSANWQSRSVTAILTPLRPQLIDGSYRSVVGRWGYINNIWNPSEMAGLAKKIKKSMQK